MQTLLLLPIPLSSGAERYFKNHPLLNLQTPVWLELTGQFSKYVSESVPMC